MGRNRRLLAFRSMSSVALLLTTTSHAVAGGLTDEQEKFLGFLGHSLCVMARDGYGTRYLDQRIGIYASHTGQYSARLNEFARQRDAIYASDQIALAMRSSSCRSVDFESQYWKNASSAMDKMSFKPSPMAPLPPRAGQEREWVRKWCSIGWRQYGDEHIERCLKLSDIYSN